MLGLRGSVLGIWWQARHLGSLCVVGAALGDMDLDFVWHASHLVTWALTFCGGCVTYGIGLVLATRWPGLVAIVAWQAWHLVTWTFTDTTH